MKLSVIIVDDDPTVIFLHKIIVAESNFSAQPEAFFSCEDTLDFLKEPSDADAYLVLLDINLPGRSGWEFMELVDKIKLAVPLYVVLITSSIHSADKEKAKHYEKVIAFMEKPLREGDLHRLKKLDELKAFF